MKGLIKTLKVSNGIERCGTSLISKYNLLRRHEVTFAEISISSKRNSWRCYPRDDNGEPSIAEGIHLPIISVAALMVEQVSFRREPLLTCVH